ncbi:prepilin-type N-terminal cleavage/methylation domain-containing protein [Tumebacillus sp. DT12]|uniref:Prepilin-type N-terminal cleavage/methylation domain-containing protein n=1 Tax=Tumebacillus lacus TaxID=2995335 RepID=A0ABT3X3G4_9BACL|nr:prepilin-type N-terminal cleavage/methylation domain-containing protein [Tumebacillus lacus]MCX7571427.1 prepilin-type N-terminal cleavage/methylation domain-containing protein [Tumebacillus lacus]
MKKWRNQGGFTLIELAIAVFVISVLIAISLPHLRGTGEKAQVTTCEGNQRLLRAQLENYYLSEKGYPTGASDADKLKQMFDLKYLQTSPSCPSGGTYAITVAADKTSATVECTVHGVLGQ